VINIEDVKRLTLGPNELLIFQVRGTLTSIALVDLRDNISKIPALKNKTMVVDDSVTLTVLAAEEVKARAA
jgi:hypothetical protein